jgi:hypothetical protein
MKSHKYAQVLLLERHFTPNCSLFGQLFGQTQLDDERNNNDYGTTNNVVKEKSNFSKKVTV